VDPSRSRGTGSTARSPEPRRPGRRPSPGTTGGWAAGSNGRTNR
jgi:hypothetical protein